MSTEEKLNRRRNGNSLRDLLDNIKFTNIQIIGVPEKKKKRKAWENIWGDTS